MSHLKIIGLGNPSRGDDAVGLMAAARLRAALPDDVEVIEHARDGAALMLLWGPRDDVVLIDAVISGAEAGTIHHRDLIADPLPQDMVALTTHTLGLTEGVELARALNLLPASLRFIGVEGQDFTTGRGLSEPVRRAVEQIIESLVTHP